MIDASLDDDYAEIGPGGLAEEPRFDPAWELERGDIELVGAPIGRGQFANVHKARVPRATLTFLLYAGLTATVLRRSSTPESLSY